MSRERGQASVEAVALAPLAVLVVLAAGQLLAAGLARTLAADAARAGAVAMLQERGVRDAARDVVPGWARRGLVVRSAGRVVSVRLRPPALLPGVAALLEAHGRADAGPPA
jgi:pilus assembly protein CpaE